MSSMFTNLISCDLTLFEIIQKDQNRQRCGIELIESEHFTSLSGLECLGSIVANKKSERFPIRSYHGENEFIDEIEKCYRDRALETFSLDKEQWGVNVKSYSGSIANLECFLGFLNLHDRIMGIDLLSCGHISHGFYIGNKNNNHISLLFESLSYQIKNDGIIDYNQVEDLVNRFRPKLIICGGSTYPRDINYKKIRDISDKVGAYLLCDMVHTNEFITTSLMESPFTYCDFVTTTTHKTLRGPHAGMIFFRKKYEKQLNDYVFPGTRRGPYQNKTADVSTQLVEVITPECKDYMKRVSDNARILATEFKKYGYDISIDGTYNNTVLVNLHNKGITGSKIETICERVNISINKHAVFGDTSPLSPGGIRLVTSTMTTRGFDEEDMKNLANLLHGLIGFAQEIQNKHGKNLIDFKNALNEEDMCKKLDSVKYGIELWVMDYYFPDVLLHHG